MTYYKTYFIIYLLWWLVNWKRYGRKCLWPNLRYYLGICVEGLKTAEPYWDIWCLLWDSDQVQTESQCGALVLHKATHVLKPYSTWFLYGDCTEYNFPSESSVCICFSGPDEVWYFISCMCHCWLQVEFGSNMGRDGWSLHAQAVPWLSVPSGFWGWATMAWHVTCCAMP